MAGRGKGSRRSAGPHEAAALAQTAHLLPKLEDCQAESVRNDFHCVQRRVRLPAFQAAQIRLIKAAPLAEFDLAESRLDT